MSVWDDEKSVKFLVDNYADMGAKAIAEKLGITKNSVVGKAKRLGVSKPLEGIKFSRNEVLLIQDRPADLSLSRISRFIERPYSQVHRKAAELSLQVQGVSS